MFALQNENSGLGLGVLLLVAVVLVAGVAEADLNDQVGQLDFDTAGLDDVIGIFGEPVTYLWQDETYTRDNLPNTYIARYINDPDIMISSDNVSEVRFYVVGTGVLFHDCIMVGSSLDDVLMFLGAPTSTVVGQPCDYVDGVLYKDIEGTVGRCYYGRDDWSVRMFFLDYNVNALYVTGNAVVPGSAVVPYSDVRWMSLSSMDLSGHVGLIETLWFNEDTSWPRDLPAGRGPSEIMADGKNPGLGVRGLHARGITGAGVNVGIIDQPLYQDHPEFAGRIVAYYDTGCGTQGSMHGPAVTSLLVGSECGTAPGANVYYVAAPSWLGDAEYYADGLDWIVGQNEGLGAGEKIRVVSVSAAPSGVGSPFSLNNEMWYEACDRAEAAGILVLDCTSHRGFISRCWYDVDSPEEPCECTTGAPGYAPWFSTVNIHAPSSMRTSAEQYDAGEFSYQYTGRGGPSWSIPYCAGVLAMGWQVQPTLKGDHMKKLLLDAAYVNGDGAKIIDPEEFVLSLEGLADVNRDGLVDLGDFAIFSDGWLWRRD